MGSDPPHFYSNNDIMEFQSTLPAWGATSHVNVFLLVRRISIHAPAWGATKSAQLRQRRNLFQSTLPHGERRGSLKHLHQPLNFNPRSRMGSDRNITGNFTALHHFNPRSRMGSDNNDIQHSVPDSHFNPRSRMGSDHPHDVFQYVSSIFQSTPPHGERPDTQVAERIGVTFQSTPPHGERHTMHGSD